MEKLSQKKERLYSLLKLGKENNILKINMSSELFKGRFLHINGNKLLNFANCSYLGLETDIRLIEAAKIATQQYGMLQSCSRSFISSPLYSKLLEILNEIIPGYSLISSTTTLGHCSSLPLLIDKEDLIIIDFHAHNSMQMAAKICSSNGTKIKYLRHHNRMDKLKDMIIDARKDEFKNIWFLGDGVYSMQGEFVDINGLTSLLSEFDNLYAYIDDAHGFGWTGKNGAGYVLGDSYKAHSKMIVALSMAKAFGCTGGIISFPNEELRDRIDLIGQTQIFSGPIPNPVLGASIASAKIFQSPEISIYQNELKNLIIYFKKKCQQEKISLNTISNSPIQFIEIGDNEKVYEVGSELLDKGIYCSIAIYPSMPVNKGGIRITLTRHLLIEDIDYFIDILKALVYP